VKTGSAHAGLGNGLSRVRGNSHARFLGEGVAATPPPYPTKTFACFILGTVPLAIAVHRLGYRWASQGNAFEYGAAADCRNSWCNSGWLLKSFSLTAPDMLLERFM